MLDLQSNKTNILVSYAYLRKSDTFADVVLKLSEAGYINLLIDSGAFTVYKSGGKILLKDYIEACKHYHDRCWQYVTLDVVGNYKATLENFKIMRNQNLNPMGVLTTDMDLSELDTLIRDNKHIGVPGGTITKGDFTKKRFQDVHRYTEGKAKIHGLGYVKYPEMYQLPLTTVDSSSSEAGKRFGAIKTFDSHKGFVDNWSTKDIKQAQASKIPPKLKQLWIQAGLSPNDRLKDDYYTGVNSFNNYEIVNAYLDMQAFSKLKGLEYFFVCGNLHTVATICAVIKSRKKYGNYKFHDVKKSILKAVELHKKKQAFPYLKELLS